jgi:hypothetical protein
MAWTPVVEMSETRAGYAKVYIRDGEREELFDIVEEENPDEFSDALQVAEERAWIRADVLNEQDQ